MGKYGKANVIDLDPLSYGIMLLGESGVGKTTLIKKVCEDLVGADGYMFLDIGKEDGSRGISGLVAEPCEDWEKFDEVITDVVDNKVSEYPDLKVIVFDTFDQLFDLAEEEVIKLHNREYPDKRTKSINAAFGGFQAGQSKAVEMVLDAWWRLKKVGVQTIFIGHVKSKSISDVVTDESYNALTSNLSQKYFNAIKTKVYFLGLAYIDRELIKKRTGRKNIVTNQEEVKTIVQDEVRRISFRDDNYSLDSKSRFADIVDSIPMEASEFINAMKDAIVKEFQKSGQDVEKGKKEQDKAAKAKEKELAKAEKERKDLNDVKNALEPVIAFIKDNKGDMTKIKPLMDKTKELGYANPTTINKLEDALELQKLIAS